MKVVILAGGLGTRMGDESEIRPKAMVEIGGKPILWHLMQYFSAQGFNQFILALGNKGEQIKRYLVDYAALQSNLTVNLATGEVIQHDPPAEAWRAELIDTGLNTQTGGRLKRLAPYLQGETFLMAWVDSLSNIDLKALIAFHRSHGKTATLSVVRPTARYGVMAFNGTQVIQYQLQPQFNEGWMNGGYFVLEPEVLDWIDGDETVWEDGPLSRLAAGGELMAYQHEGFWYCLDTSRDRYVLEQLWLDEKAPWLPNEE